MVASLTGKLITEPWKPCRDVDKRLVEVPEIREVGEYVAEIKLHPDVTAKVRLTVYAK